jgi:hypothetical protein
MLSAIKSGRSKSTPRQLAPILEDCPECDAPAGLPCKGPAGVMVSEHQTRRDLALKAVRLQGSDQPVRCPGSE